jgi:hypothetical protein
MRDGTRDQDAIAELEDREGARHDQQDQDEDRNQESPGAHGRGE